MGYQKIAVGALLCLGLALPFATGGADNSARSTASARITLYIPPRTQLHYSDVPGTGQLCLNRIPANYHLSIRDLGSQEREQKRLAGRPGIYCVPISEAGDGKMVLIVAE